MITIGLEQTDWILALDPAGRDRVDIQEIENRLVPPVPLVRDRLATADDEVLMVENLVLLDGEPISVGVTYLPADTPKVRLLRTERSLSTVYQALFGAPLGVTETVLEALPCEARTAKLLGIAEGSPVLSREQLFRDGAGVPREFRCGYFRADLVDFAVTASQRPSVRR